MSRAAGRRMPVTRIADTFKHSPMLTSSTTRFLLQESTKLPPSMPLAECPVLCSECSTDSTSIQRAPHNTDPDCRSLNELKQAREAELEARGEPSDTVSFSDFPEQSSAFIVHHTSILRNKRLLLIYT